MSFLEIRFPESIAFNSSSILEFNTTIIKAKNGYEQRNINWNSNKMKFNIINGIKTKAELDELITFFRNVKGAGYGFRFKDFTDYQAENQYIGVGNGETKEFQLIKAYRVSDNIIYYRKITKPIISTVRIFINDIESKDFNIDLTTGLITLNTTPEIDSTIKANFEFDVPVRFENDIMEITMNSINSGNVKEIILTEI